MKNPLLTAINAILVTTAFYITSAQALPTFNKLYVFGDSLSDTGNVFALSDQQVPPETRYFVGRFSNGPVWVDELAEAMNITSLHPSRDPALDLAAGDSANFAYGGSGTGITNGTPDGLFEVSGLLGQVNEFRSALPGPADSDALYIVWSGANNYLLSIPPPDSVPGISFPPDPPTTVGNITTTIQDLYALGARNFLVPNLPDLGTSPLAAIIESQNPGTQATLNTLTATHNAILDQTLQNLNSLPNIEIYSPDMNALFRDIAKDPSAFGFSGTLTDPGPAMNCLIPLTTATRDCSPIPFATTLFFWDDQHPSTAAHRLLARAALNAKPIPEPTSVMLLLVGLVGLAMVRRRTARHH